MASVAVSAGDTTWQSFSDFSACTRGGCLVNKDTSSFHYVGSFNSPSACAETCLKNSTCAIWIHSELSTHCWWRTDGNFIPHSEAKKTSGCNTKLPSCSSFKPPSGPVTHPPEPEPLPGPSDALNLNGKYILSETAKSAANEKFPTNYRDYPGGAEYFDVYSPLIRQYYSQVYWKGFDPVPLPDWVVKRFDGKGMAIIGYELDQVRQTPQGDVSVPINVVYNHHFESHMGGKKSKIEKVKISGLDDPRLSAHQRGHGIPEAWKKEAWVVTDLTGGTNALPTSQSFGGANGGEVRKSFHGYAPGYAQLIESPTNFQITPMQIDTWNRDYMTLDGSTQGNRTGKFVPGPQPRNSWAPRNPDGSMADSLYSGLLECPVTTRVRKTVPGGGYATRNGGSCSNGTIAEAAECFAAVTTLGFANVTTAVGSDNSRPPACSITTDASGRVSVFFNKALPANSAACGAGTSGKATRIGSASSLVDLHLVLDGATQTATITITGPADVWFGVGLNASSMKDAPWAIIVEGNGNVTERKLADQNPGEMLPPSVDVQHNSVTDGKRTVILTRPLKGKGEQYLSFPSDPAQLETTLSFINALGSGPTLSYHKSKTASAISSLVIGTHSCVCASAPAPFGEYKSGATISYVQTNQSIDTGEGAVGFNNRCAPQPRGDLLAFKNPTCDVRTYVGGQLACHHMWSLLDADQEIPWADQPLEYYFKFRFWFQNYTVAKDGTPSHASVFRGAGYDIGAGPSGAGAEFDVPKCAEGMAGCSLENGTWVYTTTGTMRGSGKLVAAHFHCHAPTCLSMTLSNADTGEMICEERPIYGGQPGETKYREPGFISQPPCLWGEGHGLESPPDLSGMTVHVIHRSNATYGHHGEMAHEQMYYIK